MAWANRVNTVSKQRVALFFCVRRILPALFFFGKVACGHSLFGRCLTITELMINEQIRDKEIRLIDENGEQLGIVSSREAQKIADNFVGLGSTTRTLALLDSLSETVSGSS